MSESVAVLYEQRYQNVLAAIAPLLQKLIEDYLRDRAVPRVERIVVRAKDPKSFLKKAAKVDEATGTIKYSNPLVQIQDQLGARVIVYYKGDVEPASAVLKEYFTRIEEKSLVPDSEWAFGYFGKHYIFAIPKDAVPGHIDMREVPSFFELQVKTLFQHAWAEAEHDLGYKGREELNPDQTRRLAFTAAQAWGADQVFQELHDELEA